MKKKKNNLCYLLPFKIPIKNKFFKNLRAQKKKYCKRKHSSKISIKTNVCKLFLPPKYQKTEKREMASGKKIKIKKTATSPKRIDVFWFSKWPFV